MLFSWIIILLVVVVAVDGDTTEKTGGMDPHKGAEGGGAGEVRRINVVYFLSRGGRTDHPHLFRVNHRSRAGGVRLRGIYILSSSFVAVPIHLHGYTSFMPFSLHPLRCEAVALGDSRKGRASQFLLVLQKVGIGDQFPAIFGSSFSGGVLCTLIACIY